MCLLYSLASSVSGIRCSVSTVFTGQFCSHTLSFPGSCWLRPASLFFQAAFNRGFTKNMKLEAVNPRNPGELCVASVVSVKGRLLWLHLEGMYNQLLLTSSWGSSPRGTGRFSTLMNAPLVTLLFKQILNYSAFLNK